MPVDTLLAMSQRAAARGAPRIYSVGDIPHHLVAPILAKVPSPQQLYDIEQASPHLIGCNEDLWLAFLKRDVPNFESKPHRPANPASWFKVYKKLKKQAEAEMKEGQDKLKAALGAIKQNKEQNTAVMVSRSELPSGSGGGVGRITKIRYDYMSGKTGAKGAHKMTLFEKIRKEKADAKNNKMNRPTNVRPGGTKVQAPERLVQGIVEERRRIEEEKRRDRAIAASNIRAPRQPTRLTVTGSRDEVGYDMMADREARLRALKTRQAVDNLSEARSPPMTGQKRTAEQAGLTAESLEELFDDDLDSDGDHKDDDEIFRGGASPSKSMKPASKPRPEIKTVRQSPEKKTPASPAPLASDHRKLLDPALKGGTDRQRSASPGPRIGSPKPKQVVKKKAPPNLFHTPNKRVVTKL